MTPTKPNADRQWSTPQVLDLDDDADSIEGLAGANSEGNGRPTS